MSRLWPLLPAPAVRLLREELQLLQEPGSYVGEVIKVRCTARPGLRRTTWSARVGCAEGGARRGSLRRRLPHALACQCTRDAWPRSCSPLPARQLMGKSKVLVKVNPEGKYVVDLGECGPALVDLLLMPGVCFDARVC